MPDPKQFSKSSLCQAGTILLYVLLNSMPICLDYKLKEPDIGIPYLYGLDWFDSCNVSACPLIWENYRTTTVDKTHGERKNIR